MAFLVIIAGFKGGLVNADADGRIDKIVSAGAPQFALVGVEAVVNFPKGVYILAADTFGSGMGVQAGAAMI
jgi:hypothetical protein